MKIRLLVLSLFVSLSSVAQINDTTTLRNYINANIIPNSTRSVTADQLNYSLTGLLNVSNRYKIDSISLKSDSLIYYVSGKRRGVKFTMSGIDSVWISSDSLHFRRIDGSEIPPIKLDYYTKEESDSRYVFSPSGQIIPAYMSSWDYTIDYSVPNVANIDTKYLVVNGAAGDTSFTVVGGTGTSDFTVPFVAAAYDRTGNHYFRFFVNRQSGSTYYTDRPLEQTLTADTVKTLWDDYAGQHMTNYGYRGKADHDYKYLKNLSAREYKLYSFLPEDNPTTIPFTAINGAVQGGFIPGTSSPQTLQISTSTISCAQTSVLHYLIQQGGVTNRGIEWSVNLGKKSGYLETWVGVNTILPGFAKVLFYLDGVLIRTDTVRGCVQKLTYSYSNASTGKVQIVTGDTQPAQIKLSRAVWYQTNADIAKKAMPFDGKTVFLMDSWSQYALIGSVPMRDYTERLKVLLAADGGDPSNIINVGRGGMTSAWGKYYFKQLVLDNNPKYVVIGFYINDANSSGSVGNPAITSWNFSSSGPYAAGTDVDGKVTQADWINNVTRWMVDTAIAHGITPIIIMPSTTGSVTQTQTQSAWLSALKRAAQYYDIETFFTSGVFADGSINAPIVNAPKGNIDTTVSKHLKGGTESVSGSFLIEAQEVNSASSAGVSIFPKNTHTGSAGSMFKVYNNPTRTASIFDIRNNGSVFATDFSAGPTGFSISSSFNITLTSGIVRLSSSNSSLTHLYLAENFTNTIRARVPFTLQNYGTSSLPTGAFADKGSMAYDSTKNRPAYYDSFFWWSLAREEDMFKRFDSITAKDRFIQNSTSPQTANLNITGTATVGAMVATADLVVKSAGSGMSGTSAIRFTESNTANRYGIIGKGTGANWDLQVASDNGATVLVSKGVSSIVADSDKVVIPRRELRLGNQVYNTLMFEPTTQSFGAPTLTNRSWGTKVVYRPDLTAFLADYATGIETNYLWNSVPSNSDAFGFKWYGGLDLAATLSATGNLSLTGNITATAPVYSSGGITGIGRNNASGRWEAYSPTLTDITSAGNTTSNTVSVGGLTTTGAFYPQLSVVSTGTTLTAGYSTVIGNTSSGTCTLTLPTGSPAGGRMYFIKRSSQSNSLTLNTSGSDIFDDGTTTLNVTNAVIVQLQGATWWILAKY